ncbi:MAG TPA: YiiD C-terminal domain-containing protein [Mycobacteriales bacterium]|jgi:uncharacterized protein (TIGR00369 family)|nr:YiiD C-terminal domain-containing protein [Mycobacteriales bacterium]
MTVDLSALPQLFAAAVPFAATLGIEYGEVAPGRAVARLADDPAKHNHIGTLHAGALFALGESASGLAMMATIADRLAGVTPLAARAEIEYRKVARGDVTATARIDGVDGVLATLDEAGKVRFPVVVELADAAGEVCAVLTVDWHLRRS